MTLLYTFCIPFNTKIIQKPWYYAYMRQNSHLWKMIKSDSDLQEHHILFMWLSHKNRKSLLYCFYSTITFLLSLYKKSYFRINYFTSSFEADKYFSLKFNVPLWLHVWEHIFGNMYIHGENYSDSERSVGIAKYSVECVLRPHDFPYVYDAIFTTPHGYDKNTTNI